jgi:arylformamidase
MKIYDISQELLTCEVYEGDPRPQKTTLSSIEGGDLYNLSAISMCVHNGTHIDAPSHFIQGGATVDKISLSRVVGWAYVAEHTGTLDAKAAQKIILRASEKGKDCAHRILIKGDCTLPEESAEVFLENGVLLVGVESQSVGPEGSPMAVHKLLLSRDVALLEGVRLSCVDEGEYFLFAAPISIEGSDGAPVRAVLVSFEEADKDKI